MVQLAYDLCPGKFEVGPITPTDGESTKVKVKVKVDLHGQLTVESAHTVTKVNRGREEQGHTDCKPGDSTMTTNDMAPRRYDDEV